MQAFEDSGCLLEARAILATADAIYRDFTIELSAPMHTVFVISHAFTTGTPPPLVSGGTA